MKFSASVKIKAAFTIFKWVLFTNKWWSSSSFLNYWFIPSNFLCHYTLNEWYFDNKWYMILLHFTFLHLFGNFWTEHCFPLKAPTCELHFSIFLESFELNSGFLYGHVLFNQVRNDLFKSFPIWCFRTVHTTFNMYLLHNDLNFI